MIHPPHANCNDRQGYYIQEYTDNGCTSHSLCLIPSGNNKIFPDGVKAKTYSECVVINEITFCAADLIDNITCENCTFPELINELEKIMGNNLKYEFSTNSTISVPPENNNNNEKIQCVIEQNVVIDENEKCRLSSGTFIQHEFYPDCDKSYYTCFYSDIEDTKKIDTKVIISEDPSKCLKKDDLLYCAIGYTNIPCQDCTYDEFINKAVDTFGDYLPMETKLIENNSTSTSTLTSTTISISNPTSGININLLNSISIISFIFNFDDH
ncbi:hypothetical protein BCR32DRAFT_277016 [Anaeromyces robustus]|uniref:Uncharacterized protein n=1 Tax=Anaeromyces robustus TaxID=1754192 RepID=A0A1Y1XFH5_9FUNG|nr:hypothetical protein BCR32DRAFT_277016 [Anaeromyces robustus]|eukprot:ORX84521.1 hypothetical protein BCR32DRAFT_277016 [Anaeromyces robustus]